MIYRDKRKDQCEARHPPCLWSKTKKTFCKKKKILEHTMATQAQREKEDEIVEENPFVLIDRLQEHGINVGDISKLKTAGCYTVENLIFRTKKDLCSIKGVSEAKCDKIIEAAKKLSSMGFITGTEFAQKRAQIVKVTTGCKAVDTMLGGGIETQSITEVFGEFRTGKTQLCHTLCVTSQLPEELGGGNGKVAYIDTEGTFRPERIAPIAERFGVDPDAILENIAIARAYNHEHLMNLVIEVTARMVDEPYRLLIVDSASGLFRTDFSGRGELAERQQKLAQFMSRLLKISKEFDLAVFITNQVVADPGGALFIANSTKPIGGNIMAHASTTRLSLRKGRGEQRIMKVYDSPSLPESEAIFQISGGGITDASD